jgi:hypothetical protein
MDHRGVWPELHPVERLPMPMCTVPGGKIARRVTRYGGVPPNRRKGGAGTE